MAEYIVNHRYAATRDGRQYGPWIPGQRIDLDPAEAELVNTDSPGALSVPEPPAVSAAAPEPEAEPVVEEEPKRQQRAGRNRQQRGGANRSAT